MVSRPLTAAGEGGGAPPRQGEERQRHGMMSDVRLREGMERSVFEDGVREVPQVVSGSRVTGEYDFQIRVVCVDAAEFEGVVDVLKRDHGVRELRSRLVLHDIEIDPSRLLDL